METALKSDNRCNQLLDEVVLKYSKPGDNKQPGSLARALANSSKMAAKFKHYAAEFASIDMLMGKAYEAPSTPVLHGLTFRFLCRGSIISPLNRTDKTLNPKPLNP